MILQPICGLKAIAMIISEHTLDIAADDYSRHHGDSAYSKVGDDISMAIGNGEWDKAHMLQRVQWRLRKLDRLRQIAALARLNREPEPA